MKNLALRSGMLLFLSMLLFSGCQKNTDTSFSGVWRGLIETQNQQLPFNFEIVRQDTSWHLILINAEERLDAGPIQAQGDSLFMPMHIFDAEIRARVGESGMQGLWIKHYTDDFRLPFRAIKGDTTRFQLSEEEPGIDLSGRWAVRFLGEGGISNKPVVAEFEQEGKNLTGSFLTGTGDYRFLQGNVAGTNFALSTFDGERAFLFKGQLEGDSLIRGDYWSGKGLHKPWIARRDPDARLPDADSLTYLKEGYNAFDFSFPNPEGKSVSLSDPEYRNKVVIVQLLGTWCPNCMDETRFLTDWYRQNKEKDVAIIGLAFEKIGEFGYASKRVQKMIDKMGVNYEILIAGSSENGQASQALPMLNHVMAFPTTIFIDKQGNVRKIHTGFYGPGTGKYYEEYTEEFRRYTQMLMNE